MFSIRHKCFVEMGAAPRPHGPSRASPRRTYKRQLAQPSRAPTAWEEWRPHSSPLHMPRNPLLLSRPSRLHPHSGPSSADLLCLRLLRGPSPRWGPSGAHVQAMPTITSVPAHQVTPAPPTGSQGSSRPLPSAPISSAQVQAATLGTGPGPPHPLPPRPLPLPFSPHGLSSPGPFQSAE